VSSEGSAGSASASGEQKSDGPDWYTKWENDVHSSSSMASPVMTLVACFSLLVLGAAAAM
jgi:hypothetical protein